MRYSIPMALATLAIVAGAQSAAAEQSCHVAASAMMPRAAMKQSLEQRGYTQIRALSTHNGCYEAKGFDKSGKRFELELNGQTGAVVTAE